jgi:hypothetical protein
VAKAQRKKENRVHVDVARRVLPGSDRFSYRVVDGHELGEGQPERVQRDMISRRRGAKIVGHGRYVACQMAGRSSHLAAAIRGNYAADRRATVASGDSSNMRSPDERSFGLKTTAEVRDNGPSASLFIVQQSDWLPITRQCSD